MKPHTLFKSFLSLFTATTLLVGLVSVALFPRDSFAAAPPTIISYQGRILNSAGVPITDSSVDIIFRIYDADSGGTCLWSNSSATCASTTAKSVSLTNGLFSENLGDTSTSYAAISEDEFGDNTNVYLDVNIEGESLTPRKQITATAYAVNSSLLDGYDSSTSGGTSSFVPVTDSNGNLVITGDPQSTSVSGGSLYINPSSADANEVLFGIGLGGSSRFTLDEDGDVSYIGSLSAGDTTGSDTFTFTSGLTSSDIFTIDGDLQQSADIVTISGDALTTGTALIVERADNGTNFAGTDTKGLLSVSQLDTGSTGSALLVDNAGSGLGLRVANTNTSTTNLSAYIEHSDDILEPEAGGALYILASDNSLSLNSDSSSRRAAILQIETGSEGATDTFNYIAFNEDIDGSSDAVWRVDQDGATFADGSYTGTGADYAEYFTADSTALEFGDVVSFDVSGSAKITASTTAYDGHLMGVISEDPAFIGGNTFGLSSDEMTRDFPYEKLVALTGQVRVNISSENGLVKKGDPITSASTDKHAMKATKPGMILGFALEDDDGSGYVMAAVDTGWYAGLTIATDGSVTSISDTLVLDSVGDATASSSKSSNLLSLRGSGWDGSSTNIDMSLQTLIDDGSTNARLAFLNNDAEEVVYISDGGDLVLSGKLYPSDRGALQTDTYIFYDGSDGPGGNFIRTNASGWGAGSYDFAEMFPSAEVLEAGDVVVFAGDGANVKRSTGNSNEQIAGIVSTQPGFLAGENKPGNYPIALSGRVPTRVTNEGGSILVGDPLTASSTSGAAMKASGQGEIVGYALDDFSGTAGVITAFVRAGWHEEKREENAASQTQSVTVQNLNTTGNLFLAGGMIGSVSRIEGIGNNWSIAEDGTFTTEGLYASTITSHQNEDVTVYGISSPEVTITLSGSAELENGRATITFENINPQFNDVLDTSAPIRVLVTPNGPTETLYVSKKDRNGFTVIEAEGSSDGVSFDWYAIGYRDGFAPEESDGEEIVEVIEDDLTENETNEDSTEESSTTEAANENGEEQAEEPSEDSNANNNPTEEEPVDETEPVEDQTEPDQTTTEISPEEVIEDTPDTTSDEEEETPSEVLVEEVLIEEINDESASEEQTEEAEA